jgi:hypothetical protein
MRYSSVLHGVTCVPYTTRAGMEQTVAKGTPCAVLFQPPIWRWSIAGNNGPCGGNAYQPSNFNIPSTSSSKQESYLAQCSKWGSSIVVHSIRADFRMPTPPINRRPTSGTRGAGGNAQAVHAMCPIQSCQLPPMNRRAIRLSVPHATGDHLSAVHNFGWVAFIISSQHLQ